MAEPNKPIALEQRAEDEERLFSPSAARNRDFIRDVFQNTMPNSGAVLEVGSGTGEHACHIAGGAPALHWTPSDPDPASRRSIAAWTRHLSLDNIATPVDLDVSKTPWTLKNNDGFDGVISINMIHIAPFEATVGLINGAGHHLREGGKLFLYGPFSRNGVHTAPSNADFDSSLKSRDQGWGVRDLDQEIIPLADKAALNFQSAISMPANNFVVIFQKA